MLMRQDKEPAAQILITRDGPCLVKGGLPLSEQVIVAPWPIGAF
jgi:hypothetical protein